MSKTFLRQTLLFWVILAFIIGFTLAFPGNAQSLEFVPLVNIASADQEFNPDVARCTRLLRSYLTHQNSELSEYAEVFAEEAHKHNLDCTLVVAIAGQESVFGRYYAVPHNAWGWGGGWDPNFSFASWEEGIRVISRALNHMYCQEWQACNDPRAIGKYWAEDPNWSDGVTRYMNDIKEYGYQTNLTLE